MVFSNCIPFCFCMLLSCFWASSCILFVHWYRVANCCFGELQLFLLGILGFFTPSFVSFTQSIEQCFVSICLVVFGILFSSLFIQSSFHPSIIIDGQQVVVVLLLFLLFSFLSLFVCCSLNISLIPLLSTIFW